MSAPQAAHQPAPSGRVTVAVGRLWAGGVATACVAALVAGVGVLLFRYVFDVELVGTALLLPITDSLALNYAATAFLPSTAGGAFPTQVTPSRGPGSISSLVAPMRQMQFGLKLLF